MMLVTGISTRMIRKYRIDASCPIIMNGCSTGSSPSPPGGGLVRKLTITITKGKERRKKDGNKTQPSSSRAWLWTAEGAPDGGLMLGAYHEWDGKPTSTS